MGLNFQIDAVYLQSIQCDLTRDHYLPMKLMANKRTFDLQHHSMACTRRSRNLSETSFACMGTNSSLDSDGLRCLCNWLHRPFDSNLPYHHTIWIVEDKCYRIRSNQLGKSGPQFYYSSTMVCNFLHHCHRRNLPHRHNI